MTTTPVKKEMIEFNRSDTKAIKGAAILMMLFHHLAGFPYRVPLNFDGFKTVVDYSYCLDFALACNLCVSFFFFLGGYGLYIKWHTGKLSMTDTFFRIIQIILEGFSDFYSYCIFVLCPNRQQH